MFFPFLVREKEKELKREQDELRMNKSATKQQGRQNIRDRRLTYPEPLMIAMLSSGRPERTLVREGDSVGIYNVVPAF